MFASKKYNMCSCELHVTHETKTLAGCGAAVVTAKPASQKVVMVANWTSSVDGQSSDLI